MHRKSWLHRGMCATLAMLAACQDFPTNVTTSTQHPSASRTAATGLHAGQVQFFCVVGRRAPSTASGWQTRIDTLFFPRAEVHQSGRTVNYQFWQPGVDGKWQSGAHCVVPYTGAALRRADRYFGVEKDGAAEQFNARQGMITTQGCVTNEDTGCFIDPLVVVAPPKEIPPCDACNYYPGGGDSGDGGGGGYGGGTGGSGDAYGDGPIAFGVCVGALAGVMIGTASLKPYMDAVYSASGTVDSERRMLNAVIQNGGSQEMIQIYQSRVDAAVSSYNGAVMNLAIAGGVSAATIVAAVVACSPTLLLPA